MTVDEPHQPQPLPPVAGRRSGPPVALKETCRVVAGAVPLWRLHAARLAAGGCPPGSLEAVTASVRLVVSAYDGPDSTRLRLTVRVESDGTATVRLERRLSSLDVPGGPILVPVVVDAPPPLAGVPAKPADRSWWDAAHSEACRSGGHQAAIVAAHGSASGRVVDGSTATLWLVRGDTLLTPPSPDAVPGVARAFVLERAASSGVEVRIEAIDPEEIDAADELFLTNAFAGAVAVRGRGGEVAAVVRRWFDEMWDSGHDLAERW